jgi:hypothetical protein
MNSQCIWSPGFDFQAGASGQPLIGWGWYWIFFRPTAWNPLRRGPPARRRDRRLVAIAADLAALLAGGSVPGLGTAPAKLAAYLAANSSAHKVDVVVSVLIAVPLTVYMIGVDRTLAAADHTGNGPWPMMFLYGAVMMAATVGLQETLHAVLALHGGAGLAVRRCRDRSCRAARR